MNHASYVRRIISTIDRIRHNVLSVRRYNIVQSFFMYDKALIWSDHMCIRSNNTHNYMNIIHKHLFFWYRKCLMSSSSKEIH